MLRWPEDGVGKDVCLASEVDAEIARLTAERDAAQSRINEIRDDCERRLDIRSNTIDVLIAERDAAQAAMVDAGLREAALLARAERAERAAVWAARGHGQALGVFPTVDIFVHGRLFTRTHADTDADLFRALVEACEGGRDHG